MQLEVLQQYLQNNILLLTTLSEILRYWLTATCGEDFGVDSF